MAPEDASASRLIGTRVGDYVIEALIGQGGMGLVYRAVHPGIGKQVALKVLAPHLALHPELVRRFLDEARIVNAIGHRGIIDIFGAGVLPDGRQYLLMEYLRGVPLDAYLRQRGRLDVAEALPVLDEVLAALGAAHAAGVVHRDLKPSNVFLVEQSDGTRYVKLLDFGIARLRAPDDETTRTAPNQLLGTPRYMAPEQVRGRPVGPWTDLYALGVLAFQVLTGQVPFPGEVHQVMLAQVEQAPPLPSALAPGLPAELEALLLSLLEKPPELRPASALEVRRRLDGIPRRPAEPPRERGPRGRGPWGRARAVGGVLAMGGVLLAGSDHTRDVASPTPPVATVPAAPGVFVPPSVLPNEEPEPTPSRQPAPEPAVHEETPKAGPAVKRAAPEPARPVVRPRSLLTRVEELERAWSRQVSAGTPPEPLARAFLDSARRDAERARTPEEQRKVEQRLDAWERRYLRK